MTHFWVTFWTKTLGDFLRFGVQKLAKNGSFWGNPYMAAYKAFLEQNRFCLRARARARARGNLKSPIFGQKWVTFLDPLFVIFATEAALKSNKMVREMAQKVTQNGSFLTYPLS